MQFVSIGSLGPINPPSYWLWRGSEKKRHRTSSWGSAATAGCWSPIDVINWLMNRNTILYSMVAAATLYIVHGELIQFLLYDALIHSFLSDCISQWVGGCLTNWFSQNKGACRFRMSVVHALTAPHTERKIFASLPEWETFIKQWRRRRTTNKQINIIPGTIIKLPPTCWWPADMVPHLVEKEDTRPCKYLLLLCRYHKTITQPPKIAG